VKTWHRDASKHGISKKWLSQTILHKSYHVQKLLATLRLLKWSQEIFDLEIHQVIPPCKLLIIPQVVILLLVGLPRCRRRRTEIGQISQYTRSQVKTPSIPSQVKTPSIPVSQVKTPPVNVGEPSQNSQYTESCPNS
jgi:hypothetical protein